MRFSLLENKLTRSASPRTCHIRMGAVSRDLSRDRAACRGARRGSRGHAVLPVRHENARPPCCVLKQEVPRSNRGRGAGQRINSVLLDHGVAVSISRLWPSADAGCGKATSTQRPPSGLGWAATVASCAVAMARTIDSPSPCPSLNAARRRSSRWKGWKRRSMSADGTGGPVVVTVRTMNDHYITGWVAAMVSLREGKGVCDSFESRLEVRISPFTHSVRRNFHEIG